MHGTTVLVQYALVRTSSPWLMPSAQVAPLPTLPAKGRLSRCELAEAAGASLMPATVRVQRMHTRLEQARAPMDIRHEMRIRPRAATNAW